MTDATAGPAGAKADLYALDLAAAVWRKAARSAGNGECVEVAALPGGAVAVRDSKNPHLPALRFTAAEWAAFTGAVVTGEL